MPTETLDVAALTDLETPQQIYEAGREIRKVYFPYRFRTFGRNPDA